MKIAKLRFSAHSLWIIVCLFFFALLLGGSYMIAFIGFISFLMFKEYISCIPTRRTDRRVLFLIYCAIPLQYYFISIRWYAMFLMFIPVYMLCIFFARMVFVETTRESIRAMATICFGLTVFVFGLSYLAHLLF